MSTRRSHHGQTALAVWMLNFVLSFHQRRVALPLGFLILPSRDKFVVEDWKGRTVRYTEKSFAIHLIYRPMIADYLEEVQALVRDPDHVQQADRGAFRL